MSYYCRLVRGADSFSLTDGVFSVDESFIPPHASESPIMGNTPSSNPYHGAGKIGVTANNFTFSVPLIATGDNYQEIDRAFDRLDAFLRPAGDSLTKTYFEWHSDYIATPVWGQTGAPRRCEVVWGTTIRSEYQLINRGVLTLMVKPYIEGNRQRLVSAKGGIVEDTIGTTDNRSRGIQVPEADATNGNKMTNPVFGHATWNTGWTASVIDASKNTEDEYVLFGLNSAKLTTGQASTNAYYQSINAGNTNGHVLSFYAKNRNGTAPSVLPYYATYLTSPTVEHVGNSWYRIWKAVNGYASAQNAGVYVYQDTTVFVTGFLFEEKDNYPRPFFYGDMLGHSWAATPHESKSLRSAGVLKLPTANIIDFGVGTTTIAWKAPAANSLYTNANYYLISGCGFSLYYNRTSNRWELVFGGGPSGSTTITASDTFSAGDIRVFHIVWNTSTVSLYINGTLANSGSYKYQAIGTYTYFGSDTSGTSQINGTILYYDHRLDDLNSTEILADYNKLLPVVEDGVCPIPYIWTKDGDDQVDNADSSSYENIAVVGGIPGSVPCAIEMKVGSSVNDEDIYIGNLPINYRDWIDLEFLSYTPAAPPDAKSVDTSELEIASFSIDPDEYYLMRDKEFCIMLRGDENNTGNNLIFRTRFWMGGGYYQTDMLPTSWRVTGTEQSIDLTPALGMLDIDEVAIKEGLLYNPNIKAFAKRTSGSALTFNLHYAQIFPYPFLRLKNLVALTKATSVVYADGRALDISSGGYVYLMYEARSRIDLHPGKYNALISFIGKEGNQSQASSTLTYNFFYIIPRWSLA